MALYLDDLERFCKTLHHLPANEIRALVDHKIKLLEVDERPTSAKISIIRDITVPYDCSSNTSPNPASPSA